MKKKNETTEEQMKRFNLDEWFFLNDETTVEDDEIDSIEAEGFFFLMEDED